MHDTWGHVGRLWLSKVILPGMLIAPKGSTVFTFALKNVKDIAVLVWQAVGTKAGSKTLEPSQQVGRHASLRLVGSGEPDAI